MPFSKFVFLQIIRQTCSSKLNSFRAVTFDGTMGVCTIGWLRRWIRQIGILRSIESSRGTVELIAPPKTGHYSLGGTRFLGLQQVHCTRWRGPGPRASISVLYRSITWTSHGEGYGHNNCKAQWCGSTIGGVPLVGNPTEIYWLTLVAYAPCSSA